MSKADLTLDEALAGIRTKLKRLLPCSIGLCLLVIFGIVVLRGAKMDLQAANETQTREEQWTFLKTGCVKLCGGTLALLLSPLIVAILLPTKEELAMLKHHDKMKPTKPTGEAG